MAPIGGDLEKDLTNLINSKLPEEKQLKQAMKIVKERC
jgi:hypothetical protein